jgi:HAD superfamily hydrolase (TIGR01509 family)
MGKIKAIGFDYGGVIGGGKKVGDVFNKQMAAILSMTEGDYKKAYFAINHLINEGRVNTWREFWELFLKKLGQSEKLAEVMKLGDETGKLYTIMDPQILNLIDELRHSGYKVGLLSNTTKENSARMRALDLDKHFDVFSISAELGMQKPDLRLYERFANDLGVELSELAFIDDSKTSLATSKEGGYTPILFESYEKLIVDLKLLDISY